jgi:hypothetical protein
MDEEIAMVGNLTDLKDIFQEVFADLGLQVDQYNHRPPRFH